MKLKTNMHILSKKGNIHFLLNQKRDMDQIKMGIYGKIHRKFSKKNLLGYAFFVF
jgi:hypothetical protein